VGGFEFEDPGGDLGVAAAIVTSYFDRSIDPGMVLIGEIGLTGEIRPVVGVDRRLKEAQRMGFTKVIVPVANLPVQEDFGTLEIVGVEFLSQALNIIIPGWDKNSSAVLKNIILENQVSSALE
jgi:DNA repair protein RadA/Sms